MLNPDPIRKCDAQLQGWRWAAAVGLCFIAACLAAFSGQGDIVPLESHDIFVAQTAQETELSGNLLLPMFFNTPRISKPPLMYWLVMLVDEVNGDDDLMSPGESRLPSVLAGIGVALVTLALGTATFGRSVGVIAALAVAGTSSFTSFTHSARPEMVYAFFNLAGLTSFAWALRRYEDDNLQKARSMRALGWLSLVLASLAKGPYVPLVIVIALCAFFYKSGRGKLIRPVVGPVVATVLVLAAFLVWYGPVYFMVQDATTLWAKELDGRLRTGKFDLSHYLNPYFLYTTGIALTPWLVLYPIAMMMPWLKRWRGHVGVGLLWSCGTAVIIAWQLLPGRRSHYILPVVPVFTVLVAVAALDLGLQLRQLPRYTWWKGVGVLHVAVLCVTAVVATFWLPQDQRPEMVAVALLLVLAAGVVVVLMRRQAAPFAALCGVTMVGAMFFTVMGQNGSLWSRDRIERREFVRDVGSAVRSDEAMVATDGEWYIEQYYLHRYIPVYDLPENLLAEVRERGPVYILTDGRWTPPAGTHAHLVLERDPEHKGDMKHVLRLYHLHDDSPTMRASHDS